MTRDTLVLLAMFGVLAVILTAAVLLIVDAMVLSPPPEVPPSVNMTGGLL